MIWLCKHCTTLNANISDSCAVCNIAASHKGDYDTELQDIYLEIIYWYMKAEVDNRLWNLNVMNINRIQLNENSLGEIR